MDLKFYLNKYAKIDNIENYTLSTLKILKENYLKFLEDSGGIDPDFPNFSFGGNNGETKIKGQNKASLEEQEERLNK
jgi:hypothetical protein